MARRLEEIVDSISKDLTLKIGLRIYSAIVDPNGKILVSQTGIESFQHLIENFVKTNFPYLSFGDHSVPISGHNILFFRTNKGIIVIYSPKGRIGQFLSSKNLLKEFAPQIDEELEDVTVDQEIIATKKIGIDLPKLEYSRKIWDVYPTIVMKLSGKEKIPLDEAMVINKCDGKTSLQQISEMLQKSINSLMDILQKYHHDRWIKFPNHAYFQVDCPFCKTKRYGFIPKYCLDKNLSNYVRIQLPPLECEHSFVVFLDKKQKIKTEKIEFFTILVNKIDFFDLSISKLMLFFGQDLFCNIFHALLMGKSILLIEDDSNRKIIADQLTKFLKTIFPNSKQDIQAISLDEYLNSWKKQKNKLIIDLAYNMVISEPYEREKLGAEALIFKKVLKEQESEQQILKTNQEFERLLLLIEPIITIVKNHGKPIVEPELIEKLEKDYYLTLRLEEIPLIKKLAIIYYNTDISKKIVSELSYSIW
ncbi:MAG: hypothetical protein ACTSX4_07040 [Candidatus Helarchaeota archaeon]